MPSLVAHVCIGYVASESVKSKPGKKFILLSIVVSILADGDVIGYMAGVPYGSFWGHRGFFHSIFFAAVVSTILVWWPAVKNENPFSNRRYLWFYFFFLGCSHGLLDGLTNGGMGIALLAPFDNHRYFFPVTPIEAAPFKLKDIMGPAGLRMVFSELIYLGIPLFLIWLWNKRKKV